MIDIDFFKKVNDTYGHAGGDEVLKAVSSSLSSSLGENGTVFRYGGEEFLIFLQDSNSNFISQVLEKTRSNIENLTVPYRDQVINITISIGVATTQSIKQNSISSINNSSMPAEEEFGLIRDLADEALYQAKSEGRNRIINYPNI
jgi:diguanylate cyclase (GGDEF)-like protein